MARLWFAGGEVGGTPASPGSMDGSGQATRDTTTKRTGAASWKLDSTAGGGSALQFAYSHFNYTLTSASWYARGYINCTTLPTSASAIFGWGTSETSGVWARMRTDGALELFSGSAAVAVGSPSAVVTDGSWHRVEIGATFDASNNITASELRVDGTVVATFSGSSAFGASTAILRFGWAAAPGANKIIYFDDISWNDATGAANNTWPGDGQVILMQPVSDNARGAWTAGAAGTTSLFDAVNNVPPVGVADASATNTSQIKNKSATNPSSCDLNLASYTTAGLVATDTINAICVYGVDGEDPATGTKTVGYSMVSNPAIAEPAALNFGNDSGAQATYLGLWAWHQGTISNAPSVTLGTQPVIRVRCIAGATATRAAACCFLGAYVDYTPAAVVTFVPRHGVVNFNDPGIL